MTDENHEVELHDEVTDEIVDETLEEAKGAEASVAAKGKPETGQPTDERIRKMLLVKPQVLRHKQKCQAVLPIKVKRSLKQSRYD
jgi:hypothetical protein